MNKEHDRKAQQDEARRNHEACALTVIDMS